MLLSEWAPSVSDTLKPIHVFHCHAKTFALGPGIGLDPQRHSFALGKPTCWYLKMLKFALPPMQSPNVSQWNLGCVGSPMQNSRVGHVHFMLFVLISFALVIQHKPSLQWNMGFSEFCVSLQKVSGR